MTRLSVAILTTLGIVPAAAAQAPARWKHRVLPYVTVLGGHRPAIGAAVRAWRPEDSSARVPSAGELFLGGGIGLRGVGRAEGRFRLPAAGRYRLAVTGRGSWKDRPLFTGVGNATVFDRSFEKGGRPDFYRVSLDRMNGRVEATRWLGRRFGVAANVGFDRATFTALPGTTVFGDHYGPRLEERDLTAGFTLIFDRRDFERMAGRGVLIEAGVVAGRGYGRLFGVAQGYLPLGGRTTIAIRAVGTGMSGTPPLVARFQIPVWEGNLPILGGKESFRGFSTGRFSGAAAFFVNQEVRQDLGRVRGRPIAAIGFFDAGRVFEGEPFRLTTRGIQTGAGAGLAMRGNRAQAGAAFAAVGPDGIRVSAMSGWAF